MKKSIFRTFLIILLVITMPFPVYADYGSIRIDGYYDDWEDKPHTEVYPGKNPPEDKINYVSLFRDEENVYVHVIFAHKNNQDITNMVIDLETNLEDEDYFIAADLFDWFLGPDSSESEQEQDSAEQEQTTELNNPNILSNQEQTTYFLTADNENNGQSGGQKDETGTLVQNPVEEPAADPVEEPAADPVEEPAADPVDEPAADPVDEPTAEPAADPVEESTADPGADSGSDPGAGKETTEENGNGLEDLLDLFDPINIIDFNDVVEQLSPETTLEPETDLEFDLDELNPNLNIKKPRWYGKWAISAYNGLFPVGSGYFTRTEGEPDELELYIPLSSIMHDYEGITEISMVIKKLGRQNIMCVGASSEPYIGVAVGAGIAMLSAGAYTYRKKRPLTPGREK